MTKKKLTKERILKGINQWFNQIHRDNVGWVGFAIRMIYNGLISWVAIQFLWKFWEFVFLSTGTNEWVPIAQTTISAMIVVRLLCIGFVPRRDKIDC